MKDKHFYYSLIKSFTRIIGYLALFYNLQLGITILVVSEVFGIIEEL